MKSRESAILRTLAALQFIGLVDFMIVMPLGPQLLHDLDIDAGRFSWVVSAYTLAAGLAGFVAAPWLDRLPRRPAYLVATAGLLAGTVVCGLATTFPQLLVARCVTGGFGGIQGGLALAIVADVFPLDRRGRAMGTLMVSFAVASVVGVPLGIALGTRFGWQVPFFILAVLGMPLLGLAAWSLPASCHHADGPRRHVLAHLVELLTIPAHVRAYSLIAVLMVAAFSIVPFVSTALVANVGVTQAQLPILFIASGLVTLFATRLTGRLVDGIGALRVFFGVVPLSAGCMLVITHLPEVGIWAAAPLTAALMATNASRMVTATSLVTESIEPQHRGGFMSITSSVQHIASGLGTTWAGLILEGGQGEPLRHFGAVGIIAAGLTIASLWLAVRLRPAASSASGQAGGAGRRGRRAPGRGG